MDTETKNEFDAVLQLWHRRIDAYNARRRNIWQMFIVYTTIVYRFTGFMISRSVRSLNSSHTTNHIAKK